MATDPQLMPPAVRHMRTMTLPAALFYEPLHRLVPLVLFWTITSPWGPNLNSTSYIKPFPSLHYSLLHILLSSLQLLSINPIQALVDRSFGKDGESCNAPGGDGAGELQCGLCSESAAGSGCIPGGEVQAWARSRVRSRTPPSRVWSRARSRARLRARSRTPPSQAAKLPEAGVAEFHVAQLPSSSRNPGHDLLSAVLVHAISAAVPDLHAVPYLVVAATTTGYRVLEASGGLVQFLAEVVGLRRDRDVSLRDLRKAMAWPGGVWTMMLQGSRLFHFCS